MAITIQDQPNSTSAHPVYNLLQYLVSSDNSTQDNFKIVVSIYTDLDSGGRQVGQDLKYAVRPATTQVLAQVDRIMTNEFTEDTTKVQAATNNIASESGIKKFQVQFQEFYGTVPAATGTVASGNSLYAMNASYRYMGWANTQDADAINWQYNFGNAGSEQDYNNWLTPFGNNAATVSGTTVTLTSADKFLPIKYDQYVPLRFRHDSTEARIQYQTFDSSFNLNQTGTMSSTGLTAEPKMLMVQIEQGVLDTNTYASGSIALTSDDKYLAVMYLDHSSNRNSVVKLYEIEWTACSRYDQFEIHWLNAMGGWDSHVFDYKSVWTRTNEKNDFQRITTEISGTSIVNSLNARKTGRYYTRRVDRYVLNSNIVPEWMKEGFADLFDSPLVFWRHPDLGFIQVKNVSENSFTFNRSTDMEVFNVQFTFEIDHDDIRQRA